MTAPPPTRGGGAPWYRSGGVDIHVGNVLDVLAQLPAGSCQTVVTSPPYYGLRSYDTAPVIWGGSSDCDHMLEAAPPGKMPDPHRQRDNQGGLSNTPPGGSRGQQSWTDGSALTLAAPGKVLTGGTGPASAKQTSNAGSQYGNAWGPELRGKRADLLPREESNSQSRMGTDERQGIGPPSGGRVCTRCGAWRGELGSEPTPQLYVEHIVEVFRAVRRVLHDTGTIWVNLGDSYSGSGKGGNGGWAERSAAHRGGGHTQDGMPYPPPTHVPGLGPKQLLMMPARVALALQADGWVLRSAITWAKKSPMPESVRDRPTSATEMVYLLAKNERYFWDQEAARSCADTSRATNGTAFSSPALAPELSTALDADDGAPYLRGRCDLSESQITINGTMAWQAQGFEVIQSVRFSVVSEEAEREFVIDLQPVECPTSLATVASAFERFAADDTPVRATIVDAPATPSGASLAYPMFTEPTTHTGAITETVLESSQLLANMVKEHRTALVTFYGNPPSEPLFVLGTLRSSHMLHDNKNTDASANMKNFWLLGPEPYPAAHFATFVSEIPKRAILSSTSARGQCPACGAPWRRVVQREAIPLQATYNGAQVHESAAAPPGSAVRWAGGTGKPSRVESTTTGWAPGCSCDAGPAVAQTVLDCFAGSGTTLYVARHHGRRAIGIELNEEYAQLAADRLRQGTLGLEIY